MSAYFTKQVFDSCHPENKKEKNINISDLQEGLIVINKWKLELVSSNSAEEFLSYGGLEMRMIVFDFKVKLNNEIKMNKYPANLYRDDEVKAMIQSYISDQRTLKLSKFLKNLKDPLALDPTQTNSARGQNVLSLSDRRDFAKLSADDDLFTDLHGVLPKAGQTPIMTMQEIYVQEKGQDAFRTTNINYLYNQRKDDPILEKKRGKKDLSSGGKRGATVDHDDDDEAPTKLVGKVRKSLKLQA